MDQNTATAVVALGTVVLAVATVALTIATFVYARAARATVHEMQAQRIQSVRPHLVLTPWILGAIHPMVHLTNTGTGYALRIVGELRLSIDGEVRWRYQLALGLMAPGAVHRFDPKIDDADQIAGGVHEAAAQDRRYAADLDYVDTDGRHYRLTSEIDWGDLTEHLFGAHQLREADSLANIASDIRAIRDRVNAAVSTFDGVRVTIRRTPDEDAETGARA